MEPWELAARERIRDTLTLYNWSGDSLRLDDLARAFCEDGVLEVRGQQPVVGRDAIVTFISGVRPSADAVDGSSDTSDGSSDSASRIVRHNVTNVRFADVTPSDARVESYFTVFTEIGLDHMGRYRDHLVRSGSDWLIEHRQVSTDWHAPGSVMKRSQDDG